MPDEATYVFTFVMARQFTHHPIDGFVDRLQQVSLLAAIQVTRLWFLPGQVSFSPAKTPSLSWTRRPRAHNRA